MRKYNFPVSFMPLSGGTMCRVILDERFTPEELINDFPKTITSRYLNDVLGRGRAIATFRAATDNSIEVDIDQSFSVSDVDRAITLNLLDFGQDYESERSTTIREAIFYTGAPETMSTDKLQEALEIANEEAGLFMTARLTEFPPSDPELVSTWPQDWVEDQKYDWPGYHFFHFSVEYGKALGQSDLDFATHFLNAAHDVNMWDGYNPGMSAAESVASGRAGLSFEVDGQNNKITYVLERSPCDPAFSVKLFVEAMQERIGDLPTRWEIGVEPED
ncbi:hypothetical protein [Agrobacterium tumefaciens]|uniref:hypothetical protein n=1 Tax=Agrobacterium tumefaciens TaxID=358 RepID=UPI001572C055|nr:hypothetical protein [Agrobacterium tumefaciens]NSX92769.1 hypothetical protein [Agrobacterium tumefaciens]